MLTLPNPASAISSEFTSPLEAVRIHGVGASDRRERPAVAPRSPARRGERAAGANRATRRRWSPGSRASRTTRRWAAGWRARRGWTCASSRGRAGRNGSRRCFASVREGPRDFAATARARPLPGLPRRRSTGTPSALTCGSCGRQYGGPSTDFLDLRPHESFEERTKYLDEALHADARHERVSPPLLGSKIRNDMLRAFLAPGAGRSRRRSRLRQRARRCCGTATGSAHAVGIDIARSSRTSRARRWTCCSAICGVCRSPTARSRRHTRSTCWNTCRPRRCAACCAKPRGCSRRAGSCSSTRTSGRTRAIAVGLRWINALARRLERAGLIDMRQERLRKSDHLNPLADIPELRRVAAETGLPHQAHPLLHAARRAASSRTS